jgi:hypothetical protein
VESPDSGLFGTASSIVQSLAAGYTVTWNTVDWYIPENTLFPSNQSPIEVIKDIVGAVGAVLQTEADGSLTVEPLYPVRVPDWETTPPDYTVSDAVDFFSTGEDFDARPGFNLYTVSNESEASNNVTFEEESDSKWVKTLKAYVVPWQDDFNIDHTGGDWVVLQDEGVEEREVEKEIVEFVVGESSTQYPVYELISYRWLQDDLGEVTFKEDGTLFSADRNESLLEITYKTKCYVFKVRDNNDEQVQVVAEDNFDAS